jgi:hypothetical protein
MGNHPAPEGTPPGDDTRRGNQGAANNPPGNAGPSRDADKFKAEPGVSSGKAGVSPADAQRGWSTADMPDDPGKDDALKDTTRKNEDRPAGDR